MKIGNNKLTYILEDYDSFSKVNILQGDSATGKTCLAKICQAVEHNSYGYTTSNDYPIHVVISGSPEECNSNILKYSDTLIIIDDDSSFLQQDMNTIISVIQSSTNKFIIFSRDKKLKQIPDIEMYFIETTDNNIHYLKRSGVILPF